MCEHFLNLLENYFNLHEHFYFQININFELYEHLFVTREYFIKSTIFFVKFLKFSYDNHINIERT